jgi:hypothetical protein
LTAEGFSHLPRLVTRQAANNHLEDRSVPHFHGHLPPPLEAAVEMVCDVGF